MVRRSRLLLSCVLKGNQPTRGSFAVTKEQHQMKPALIVAHKKLLMLGLMALAVTSITGATMVSLALFTDDTTVDNNAFTTGTISLAASPASALFSLSAMMPGDETYGQLTLTNDGSAQLRYAMTASATDPDSLALADAVSLEIRVKASGTCSADFTGPVVMSSVALSGAAFGDPAPGADSGDRTLDASASDVLCFKASLPLATGNGYQGAATAATFTFQAEQTANNP
jgi:predicted ribosomally synthesized peptide with SipW-like signal peptide